VVARGWRFAAVVDGWFSISELMSLTRRSVLKGVLGAAVGTVTGAGVYGGGYERHRVGLTETRLPVRGLPAAFDGLRVALLTDIHHSALVPAEDVARAVDLANAQTPDLVILGGDYVTTGDRAFMRPVGELLGRLSAPLGVYAILGNHDDDRDMPAALARHRIEVLKDEYTQIERRGDRLTLGGIRFWTRDLPSVTYVLRGAQAPVLLLAHDPRRLTEAAALGYPAVLSGHTHGGQIVIPGLGAVAARKFPVAAGQGRMDHTTIFVSRGIGTVYLPVRINCPPEVALVTLERANA
jgi:predicted MPP superfamily phosphohydrolase